MNRFIVNVSLLLSILSVPNILAQSSGSSDEDLESNNPQIRAIKSGRDLNSGATFTTESSFLIFSTSEAKESCDLHETAKEALDAQGFTKVLCPFGVLIVGDSDYPDDGLKYGANIIASILDNNNVGLADFAVLDALAHQKILGHGVVLMCGSTVAKQHKEEFFDDIFSYIFTCNVFKDDYQDEKIVKKIIFEVSFEFVLQNGWAVIYPDIFGMKDYTSSVICRETARYRCTSPGFFHPDNTCPNGSMLPPGSPETSPLKGGCEEPDCDCSLFFRQFATAYMNWVDVGFTYSNQMPTNKAQIEHQFNGELLNVMKDPVNNQLQAPLTGLYTQTGMTGTILVEATKSPTAAPPDTPDRGPCE